jgi:hypothetical protein
MVILDIELLFILQVDLSSLETGDKYFFLLHIFWI